MKSEMRRRSERGSVPVGGQMRLLILAIIISLTVAGGVSYLLQQYALP